MLPQGDENEAEVHHNLFLPHILEKHIKENYGIPGTYFGLPANGNHFYQLIAPSPSGKRSLDLDAFPIACALGIHPYLLLLTAKKKKKKKRKKQEINKSTIEILIS